MRKVLKTITSLFILYYFLVCFLPQVAARIFGGWEWNLKQKSKMQLIQSIRKLGITTIMFVIIPIMSFKTAKNVKEYLLFRNRLVLMLKNLEK